MQHCDQNVVLAEFSSRTKDVLCKIPLYKLLQNTRSHSDPSHDMYVHQMVPVLVSHSARS